LGVGGQASRQHGATNLLMYEAAFRNIDDTLWKNAGCSSALGYKEQLSHEILLREIHGSQGNKYRSSFIADDNATAGIKCGYTKEKTFQI
jgi:type I restriction enzyme M protein